MEQERTRAALFKVIALINSSEREWKTYEAAQVGRHGHTGDLELAHQRIAQNRQQAAAVALFEVAQGLDRIELLLERAERDRRREQQVELTLIRQLLERAEQRDLANTNQEGTS